MLNSKPYFDRYLSRDEGYLKHEQLSQYQEVNKLTQFPSDKISTVPFVNQGEIPGYLTSYNAHTTSADPISNIGRTNNGVINTRASDSGADTIRNEFRNGGQSVNQKLPEQVSAFGLVHAEHARRLYYARTTYTKDQSTSNPHLQVSNHQAPAPTVRKLLPKAVNNNQYAQYKHQAHLLPFFKANTRILKRAKISSRPARTSRTLLKKTPIIRSNKCSNQGSFKEKEFDFFGGRATCFQILCESY